MIKVQNLTRRFGQVTAVDDVSFEIARGEVVGFLGPNGAGKTTTMRILTGFIPATSGAVSIDGYDVFEEPLVCKRRIGYLPEVLAVYGEMDVTSYLRFVSAIKGLPRAGRDADIERVLRLSDLVDRRNRTIGHLSKGLKKRVGLAQALLGNPDVLILDEPAEGLDPNQVVAIRDLIRSLASEHTIILSTHILSEVEATCSRVLIIDRGRLVASDAVDRLREQGRDGVTLRLRVRGEAEALQRALAPTAWGKTAVVTEAGEDLAVQLAVLRREDAAEVAAALVQAGLGLLELNAERTRLEDVFVRLTRNEPVAAGAEGVRS